MHGLDRTRVRRQSTAGAHGLPSTRHRQRLRQRMLHRLVGFSAVTKTYFDFGGMHIHIHPGGVDIKVQRIHRLALAVQHIFIGAASGVTQHTVTHIAAIHIGKLVVGTGPGSVGQTGSPQHPQTRVDMVNRYRGFDKLFAQHIGQTCVQSVVV